jgi:predicted RNase H-like HicB family nuclease
MINSIGVMVFSQEMDSIKIIIEKHEDGYVSYPIGLKGVVVGQGDTYDEALDNIRSAIKFHIETFGEDAFEDDSPVLEAYIAETSLAA